MKAILMLNGMIQMLDFMGEDAEVTIQVKLPDGTIFTSPLKTVGSGSNLNGIVLSNVDDKTDEILQ